MSSESKSTLNTSIEVYHNKYIVKSIAHILTEIISDNKKKKYSKELLETQKKYSFYSNSPASICIAGYLDRVLKLTHIEESTMIVALILIDRICEYNDLILTEWNTHRLLFMCVILAIKINEDDFYSNSYYCKVGGISMREFHQLEHDILKLLDYNLYVNYEIFEKYKIYLYHYELK